jgi:hypothetical protein
MYKSAILLFTKTEFGYGHINAHAIARSEEDIRDYHYAFTSKLVPADYSAAFDAIEIGVTSQLGSGTMGQTDIEREPYAIRIGIKPRDHHDYFNADTCKRLAKASMALESRLSRLESELGYSDSLEEMIIRLGVALKCGFVVKDDRFHGGFKLLSPTEARYWIKSQIRELNERLFPVAA